eukprot:TRINITY_DN6631_c1_g1_i1.p1 TRINITY_DN6631_c1_g1~~TRINITY_DN6631_c1_g1_i1.p1  ORF type:complete len:1727 (+),score=701.46 TRINITY_DN6631_c1_g1_i1:69-5183(+)
MGRARSETVAKAQDIVADAEGAGPAAGEGGGEDKSEMINRCLVYARLRPCKPGEIDPKQGIYQLISLQGKRILLDQERSFDMDGTFGQDCVNKDIYLGVGKPAVDHVMRGYKAAILAYGQTGTGKSYTMSNFKPGQEGVIPLCVQYLLTRCADDQKRDYKFEANFVQIYRDSLSDLMQPEATKVDIRFDAKDGVSLPGCSTVPLETTEDFREMYTEGDARRVVRATLMNPESSRGHTALVIHIRSEPKPGCDGGKRKGKITFIDLAGYERFSKTGISGNPIHKDEAKTINASLCALGHVVSALSAGDKHVPWRNAKLTRMLQDSIGGTSRTSIMITLGPSSEHVFETTNSIEFGMRAMDVKVAEKIEENVDFEKLAKRLQAMLAEKEGQINQLEMAAAARQAETLDRDRRHKRDLDRMRDRHRSQLEMLMQEGGTPERIQALLKQQETENEVLQDQIDLERSVMDERHMQEEMDVAQEVQRESQRYGDNESQTAELRACQALLAAACGMVAEQRGGTAQDVEEELRQSLGETAAMSPRGMAAPAVDNQEFEEFRKAAEAQQSKAQETIDKMKRAQLKLAENVKRMKKELAEAGKHGESAAVAERLQGEVDELKQTRAAAQEDRDGLARQLQQLKPVTLMLRAEKSTLKQQKAEVEQQLRDAQVNIEDSAKKVQVLEEKCAAAEAGRAQLTDANSEFERKLGEAEAHLSASQATAKKRQERISGLEQQLEEVREEFRRRDRERTAEREDHAVEGTRRLDQLSEEAAALRKQVAKLEDELEELTGALEGKSAEAAQLAERVSAAAEQRKALEQQLEAERQLQVKVQERADGRVRTQQRELEDAQTRAATELDLLSLKIGQKEAALAECTAKLEWLEAECVELKQLGGAGGSTPENVREELELAHDKAGMAAVLEDECSALRGERDLLSLELRAQSKAMDSQAKRINELNALIEEVGGADAVRDGAREMQEQLERERAALAADFDARRAQLEAETAELAEIRAAAERNLADREALRASSAATEAQQAELKRERARLRGQFTYSSKLVTSVLASVGQRPTPPKAPPLQSPQEILRSLQVDELKQALSYRIIITGGSGVGKSSVQKCLCTDKTPLIKRLPSVTTPSLALNVVDHADRQEKPGKGGLLKRAEYNITHYQVWDTPSGPHFLAALPAGILPVKGAVYVLCYDLTRPFESEAEQMEQSLRRIAANCAVRLAEGERLRVAVVGTKRDHAHRVGDSVSAAVRWFSSLPTAVESCSLVGSFAVSCRDWSTQSDVPDGPASFPQLLRLLGRQLHRQFPNTPPALLDDEQGYGTGASLDFADWWELSRQQLPVGGDAHRSLRQSHNGLLTLLLAVARLRQRGKLAIGGQELSRMMEEHFSVPLLQRLPGLREKVRELLCDRGLAFCVQDPDLDDPEEAVLFIDVPAIADVTVSLVQPHIYLACLRGQDEKKASQLLERVQAAGFYADKVTRSEWKELQCGRVAESLTGLVLRRSAPSFGHDSHVLLQLLQATSTGFWVESGSKRELFVPTCADSRLSPEIESALLALVDKGGGHDGATLDVGHGPAVRTGVLRHLCSACTSPIFWGDAVAGTFPFGFAYVKLPPAGKVSACAQAAALPELQRLVTEGFSAAGDLEAEVTEWEAGLPLDGLPALPAQLSSVVQGLPAPGALATAIPPERLYGTELPELLHPIESPLYGVKQSQFTDPAA